MTEARLLNFIADLNDARGYKDAYAIAHEDSKYYACCYCKEKYPPYYMILTRSRFLSLSRVRLIQNRLCPACISTQTLFPDYDFLERFGRILEKLPL